MIGLFLSRILSLHLSVISITYYLQVFATCYFFLILCFDFQPLLQYLFSQGAVSLACAANFLIDFFFIFKKIWLIIFGWLLCFSLLRFHILFILLLAEVPKYFKRFISVSVLAELVRGSKVTHYYPTSVYFSLMQKCCESCFPLKKP